MGARLGSGARLFEASNAHASGLCVWVLAGVRCREGPQMLLRIHRRWCQMLPFVSVFWGGGTGKPSEAIEKGECRKGSLFQKDSSGAIGQAELRQGLDLGGDGRYAAWEQRPGLLCQWPQLERWLYSCKGRTRCEMCFGRSVPWTG